MNDKILETEMLTKRFGPHSAVDRLNMTIERGEIYGFLGRNGAGKTTSLRMITNLLTPTSGVVRLFGDPLKTGDFQFYQRVGVVMEFSSLYPNLSARENLELHGRMMGFRDQARVTESLKGVGLAESGTKKVAEFSLGMKQRLAIARALLHHPELLILDEPTNGLDPVGIREVRELLRELTLSRGITILISSHILPEIQQLATRIGIIHRGRLLEEIDTPTFWERNRSYLKLRVDDAKKTAALLEDRAGIGEYVVEDGTTLRLYQRLDEAAEINAILVGQGIRVGEISPKQDNLESYFIGLTGGDGEGGDA